MILRSTIRGNRDVVAPHATAAGGAAGGDRRAGCWLASAGESGQAWPFVSKRISPISISIGEMDAHASIGTSAQSASTG